MTLVCFILSIFQRNKTEIKNNNFSVILFFFVMSYIISFQIPLEIAFGNTALLQYRFIFDVTIVNKMVCFSGLILDVFIIGVTFGYLKRSNSTQIRPDNKIIKKFNIKPLFYIIVLCFLIFALNLDSSYVSGGHGSVKFEGIGFSFYTIFSRLSIIYIAMVLFNNQINNSNGRGIKDFFKLFNKSYLAFLAVTVVIFFLAHNRVFVILTLTPFLFAFFVFTRKKVRSLLVIAIFLSLSIFATLFKLYGIDNILDNDLSIGSNYAIAKSYFPFTAELANSIYSQTILFSKWYHEDFLIYGYSFFIGILRIFPGLAGYLAVDPMQYDTAVIATRLSSTTYGVGTTTIADVLVNFDFLGSILVIFYLGYIFSKKEMQVYASHTKITSYIIYFSITSFVLFIPRASLNDLFATIFFNLLFVSIYPYLFRMKTMNNKI